MSRSLTKGNNGPDVLCGWATLAAVVAAARSYAEHRQRQKLPPGAARLLRQVRTIERWMKDALDTNEVNPDRRTRRTAKLVSKSEKTR